MKKHVTDLFARGGKIPDIGSISLIRNWETLASILGFKLKVISWTARNRTNLVKGFPVKSRYVYSSASPLCFVQKRLGKLFSVLMDRVPDEDVAIAYRKGLNPADALQSCTNYKVMVATDIRHYYDSVMRSHIMETLRDCGFRGRGPRIVANLCCVEREVLRKLPSPKEADAETESSKATPEDENTAEQLARAAKETVEVARTKPIRWRPGESAPPPEGYEVIKINTLQQGSPASPALSNLVGNKYFDEPILQWLRANAKGDYKYVRYCDNIVAFFADGGKEQRRAYEKAVRDIAKAGGFRTHNWTTTYNDDRCRRQQFLGMCLNRVVNLPKWNRDRLRATLFNLITKDTAAEARRLLKDTSEFHDSFDDKMSVGRAAAILGGYAAYGHMINEKFGTKLRKLHMVLDKMVTDDLKFDHRRISKLKTYARNREKPDTYMRRMGKHLTR